MNSLIQNILIFSALILSIGFLVRKYIWIPKKKKANKACGQDGCGC
ncbi:MAG: FeoB-associated Cys-rich membrane protein [Flavobacteriaceae bacterium]|nr:MAG: FeoB-associated Cys-rich membrane protein [Flavobacteriaceae bacterium]